MTLINGSDDDNIYESQPIANRDTDEIYPSEWHVINSLLNIECRRISLDTFELRSDTHITTLNREGFDLYRDGSEAGQVVFEDWIARNNVVPRPREDVNHSPLYKGEKDGQP